MPFKRNPINAENMDSLARYLAALPRVAWDNAAHSLLERTLDDSANRRSVLPEAFLIADEMLRRGLRLIEGLRVDREASERLLAAYGPFAATERLLMELVKRGGDRQALHEVIREHAMAAWAEVQAGRSNPLIDSALLAIHVSRSTHHVTSSSPGSMHPATSATRPHGRAVRGEATANCEERKRMKVSVILAHPYPGSFNHAIAETVGRALIRNGHDVIFHDLCAEGFDPILPGDEIPNRVGSPRRSPRMAPRSPRPMASSSFIPTGGGSHRPSLRGGWTVCPRRRGLRVSGGRHRRRGSARIAGSPAAVVFNTSNTPLEGSERHSVILWRRSGGTAFSRCGVRARSPAFGVIVTSTPPSAANG